MGRRAYCKRGRRARPLPSRALRETGYGGWIAMEPFVYEPDGPTCAARMIGYVAGLLEPIA